MNTQLGLPAIEPRHVIVEVTVIARVHRLQVDADDWEGMDEQERAEHIHECAEELGWFGTSYVVEGKPAADEATS